MGSTSFLFFSCPNLLLVFSELVIFRNLFHIFSQVLGLSLGLFLILFALKSKKEKVLDRGQNGF